MLLDSELSDLEFEYLTEVLMDINGIAKHKAGKIITLRDSFCGFNNITENELNEIQSLSSEQVMEVITVLQSIDFDSGVEILFTKRRLELFLRNQFRRLNRLTLDSFDINMFLIKALGFTTAEEAIEFYLYQRITRSAVTSWGQKTIEDICILAGAEKIPSADNVGVSGKNFDLKKVTPEKTYYIQVKSGPNTMNIGMVQSLNDMINKIERNQENVTGILGMTYGERSQISSQIMGALDDAESRAKIGKEFWALLSGRDTYYTELIELIDNISHNDTNGYNMTFLEAVVQKKQELEAEWEEKYGSLGSSGLDAYVQSLIDGA